MARVSEKELPTRVENKITAAFKQTLKEITKEEDAQAFLYNLLTIQEQSMLCKRLAIGILLTNDIHYRKICNLLKVTPTTVQKIKNSLHRSKRYQMFFEKTSNLKDSQILLKWAQETPR